MPDNIRYTIIIPVRKNLPGLRQTLESIVSDASLSQHEILVANDGADPGISLFLKQKNQEHNEIKEITIGKSHGSYHARNEAIRQARGEFLLFFDDSLVLPENWFSRIHETIEKVSYVAGSVKIKKHQPESLGQQFFRLTAFHTRDYFERLHFGLTCFLAVHKAVFDQVGLFEERLFSGGDMEFGDRVYRAGISQAYFDGFSAIHPSKSWKQQYRAMVRIYKGRQDLARIFPERFAHVRSGWKEVVRIALEGIYSIVFYRKNNLYRTGEMSFGKYARAQAIFHLLAVAAKKQVLLFPHRKFNL